MTIKQSLAAIAAAFSVVLLLAPSAHAEEKTTDKKEESKQTTVTVQAGDTLTSIAEAHGVTYVQLYNANAALANPDLIDVGNEIRIPKTDEELPDRYSEFAAQQAAAAPVYAASTADYAPVYSQTYTPGAQAVYATDSNGNTYFKGYCTWYAKERRPDLPNRLGNGGQWVANAAAQGYATGSKPQVGAIAETSGHVTYVEAVHDDGTITISDMNGRAGFGNVGTQRVSAGNYRYIY